MNILRFQHKHGWQSRISLRKTDGQFLIEQYKGDYNNPEFYRQVNLDKNAYRIMLRELNEWGVKKNGNTMQTRRPRKDVGHRNKRKVDNSR